MKTPRGSHSANVLIAWWQRCRSVRSLSPVGAPGLAELPGQWTWVVCAAVIVLTSGCNVILHRPNISVTPVTFTPVAVTAPSPVDPELLKRPVFEYRLGPGDVLDIEVLADGSTQATSVVGPDGKIYFYLLPGIDVWGLTLPRAREVIMQEMQKLVREQQAVSVSLRKAESQRVLILGRVDKPGTYALAGPMTLLEIISEAGGLASAREFASTTGTSGPGFPRAPDEFADLSGAFIIREGRMLRVDFNRLLHEGDMSQNVYLLPDDFIYLPSATVGNVHVLGAVQSPGTLRFTNRLTLLQAVSRAGGPDQRNAHLPQVAIVRGAPAQPEIAVVDMNAILAGQAPDVALEPQDIVFVPDTPYRVLTRYVELILDTYVRTVGVNERTRAVDYRTHPLGVTAPPGPL